VYSSLHLYVHERDFRSVSPDSDRILGFAYDERVFLAHAVLPSARRFLFKPKFARRVRRKSKFGECLRLYLRKICRLCFNVSARYDRE
jgi:hypothetical protein